MSDASVWLPSLTEPFVRTFVPLVGKSAISDIFAGFFDSLAMICTSVHVSDASIWFPISSGSPMRNTAALAGKSGVIDMIVGLLELFALIRACARRFSVPVLVSSPSDCSVCYLGLPVGTSTGYRSIGHVLTCPCMSSVVPVCIATPFVPMRIFSVLRVALIVCSPR